MSSLVGSVWRGVHYATSFSTALSRAALLAPWRALGSLRSLLLFLPGASLLLRAPHDNLPPSTPQPDLAHSGGSYGVAGAGADDVAGFWQRWAPTLPVRWPAFQGWPAALGMHWPSGFGLRQPGFQMPWLSFFVFVGFAGPILTTVYPLVQSVKTLQSPTVPGARQWLTYWIVLAGINAAEATLRNFNQWEAAYALARLALCAWLVHPATRGAETLALLLQRALRPLAKAPQEEEGGTEPMARPAQESEPRSGGSRKPALERELAGVSQGATSAGGIRKARDVALPAVETPADPLPRGSMIPVMVLAETHSEPAAVNAEDALLPEIPMGEVNAGTLLKSWEEAPLP